MDDEILFGHELGPPGAAVTTGVLGSLSIVDLSPAEETTVEGMKEEDGKGEGGRMQRERCYAREGGTVRWRDSEVHDRTCLLTPEMFHALVRSST